MASQTPVVSHLLVALSSWRARARLWSDILLGTLLVALGAMIRVAVFGPSSERLAYLTFWPLVMIAALVGGAPAGATAILLSALVIHSIFIPLRDAADWFGLAVFLCFGGLVVGAADFFVRARAQAVAEKETATVKSHLAAIVESSADPIISKDLEGTITSWNAAATRLFGYDAEQMVGQSIMTLIPSALQAEEAEIIARLKVGERIDPYETSRVGRNGNRIEVSLTVSPIYDNEDAVVGASIIIRDISERKRAEIELRSGQAALRESEERFGALIEACSDVVYRMSPDWTVMRHLIGHNFIADTVAPSGTWVQTYIHPIDQPQVMAVINDAIRNKSVFELEHRVLRADGGIGWTHSRAVPVLDPSGEITEWVGMASDITARKAAEENLRSQAALLELAHDAIMVRDPDDKVTFWNRGAESTYGWKREEALGRVTYELLRTRFPKPLAELMAEVNEKGRWDGELIHTRKDGQEIIVTSRWALAPNEAEGPAGILEINREITERKRAEENTRRHGMIQGAINRVLEISLARQSAEQMCEACLSLLEEATASAISFIGEIGPDGLLHSLAISNPAWDLCKMRDQTGRRGQPVDFRIHGIYGRVLSDAKSLIANDPASHPDRIGLPEGHPPLMNFLGAPLRRDGKTVGMIAVGNRKGGYRPEDQEVLDAMAPSILETLDHKRAEEALREADHRKDEFLAMLAHELRNPLGPIRNGLDILRMGVDGAKTARVQEMMARQVDQLVRLVDDLLETSRVSRGRIELRLELVDLSQIVNEAVFASQSPLADLRHQVIVSLPSERLPLKADPTRLAQVVTNLLNNAAKFTEPGGRIEISARREDREAVVSVKDSGIGIPPDKLRWIFDLFTQVDSRADHSRSGLGIGLALVRSLVEMHGGRVEAHSEGLGRGSEFVVRLPLAEPSIARVPESAAIGAAAPESPRRVLVVDDNLDVADALAMLLKTMDADVRVAYGGRSALEIAADFRPEVVLLDLGMPEVDGYETARHLRHLPDGAGFLLVALTGWGEDKDFRRTQEAGFDRHLVKPVRADVMQALLAERR
jgi:PAS domain S-box-containing protein